MLKNLNPRQHLTPLVLLFFALVLATLVNFIEPGEGWGYIAGFAFGIFGLILLSVHIILCLVTSNIKAIWVVEAVIASICVMYAFINGLFNW